MIKFREIGWGRVVIKGRRRDGSISDGDEEEGSGNAGNGLHTTQMYLILHTESGLNDIIYVIYTSSVFLNKIKGR